MPFHFKLVEQESQKLGLTLNHVKSEFICPDSVICAAVSESIPDISFTPVDKVVLLGLPIGSTKAVELSLQQKLEHLQLLCNHIVHFHPQDALLLLRNSLAVPKLLHLLRSSPCFPAVRNPRQVQYSSMPYPEFSHQSSSAAWIQASSPVSVGGLGIRRLKQLSTSAFLSFVSHCSELTTVLLPERLHDCPNPPFFDQALSAWQVNSNCPPPPLSVAHLQRAWDSICTDADFEGLLSGADSQSQARLHAVHS